MHSDDSGAKVSSELVNKQSWDRSFTIFVTSEDEQSKTHARYGLSLSLSLPTQALKTFDQVELGKGSRGFLKTPVLPWHVSGLALLCQVFCSFGLWKVMCVTPLCCSPLQQTPGDLSQL